MVIPGRCNGGKRLYHWRLQTQIKRKRIYETHNVWWVAGLGGALIGTVWNFAASAALVWRRP